MDYTQSDANVIDAGTGQRMHQSTSPVTTEISSDDMNAVTWELLELVKAAGLIPAAFNKATPGSYMQVRDAVAIMTRKQSAAVSNATGSADALNGVYTPVVAALINGLTLNLRAANANATTAPTFTPANGVIAGKTIVKGNNLPLVAGDISGAGHWIELQYDLTLDKWVLLNPSTGIRGRESVNLKDFGGDITGATDCSAALQSAINSGAKKIKLTYNFLISAGVNLAANQVIDFDGGSLTTSASVAAPNGILYGNAKAGVRIIDPYIDASATTGAGGINLVDCPNGRIDMGLLVKCSLSLQSSNNAIRMGYKVRGTVVNLASYATTAVYVSAVKGASLIDLETFGGKEGVGIYNNSTNIKHVACESYSHTQDGFVIISGQHISYSSCIAYSNGQSGFTTQRQTAASNCLDVSYASCQAYSNAFDGFDFRGATSVTWSTPIRITCVGCTSSGNSGTGFYVVYAEGTVLSGCIATANLLQGFLVNGSASTTLQACQSHSNASTLSAGTSKAGIQIQDSAQCSVIGCFSENTQGATQQYGVSFTGASTDCSLIGGNFQNNTTSYWNIDATAKVAVSGAAANTSSGVWINYLNSQNGMGDYSGVGLPTFTAIKGSVFHRVDGGSGEIYICNGGTSWNIR